MKKNQKTVYLKAFMINIIALLIIYSFNACNKNTSSNNNTQYGNTPIANAINDKSAAGIYKGTVVGSSGYYLISINNNVSFPQVYAILNFDNIKDSLVCSALNGYVNGQNIVNAVFTSALGTNDSIILNVNADGTNATVKIIIPGHETTASIYKETSETVVKLFQGDVFDTLVAGYFNYPCNSNGRVFPNDPNAIKVSPLNIAVKGGYATFVIGKPYLPSGSDSCKNQGDLIIFPVQNNTIDQTITNCDGTQRIQASITDTEITGTVTHSKPYLPINCSDIYSSSFKLSRIK